MRFRSTFLAIGALGAAATVAACPASNNNGSNNGVGAACKAPGSQSNCGIGLACKNYLDVPVPDGTQTIAVCQQTCTSNSDCNATYPKNVCMAGVCACTPGPVGSDPCTAANPNTVCQPDFDYCATVVDADAGCNTGEEPTLYDGVTICRPSGASVDGGEDGGTSSCGYDNTEGSCPWPQFCSGQGGVACAFPQNVDDAGTDAPDPACSYTGGPDATDNADQLRETKGTPFGKQGPIVISLIQDQSGLHCDNELGPGDQANNALCFGDGKYCGASFGDEPGLYTDDVVVFNGYAYDPTASFAVDEGTELDGQFYAIVETGSNAGTGQPLSATDPAIAYNQIGHIVPDLGNWTAVGGQFVLWRCFLSAVDAGTAPIVTQVGGTLIPADYAKTSGSAGNTYCGSWGLTDNEE
jgi:hypothetical protein